jgi:anti-anti-sigma factor
MLSFTVNKLGDVTVFRCAGRLTAGDGDVLRDAVPDHAQTRTVVLDLAEVRTVDAAGLGTLVAVKTWASASGKSVKLMNLTPIVEQVLEVTRLRSTFEVCSVPEMLDLLCHAMRQSRWQAEGFDVAVPMTAAARSQRHSVRP